MKKIITTTALLLTGLLASQADFEVQDFQDGFYVGGNLGTTYGITSSTTTFGGQPGLGFSEFTRKELSVFADLGMHGGFLSHIAGTNWAVGPHVFAEVSSLTHKSAGVSSAYNALSVYAGNLTVSTKFWMPYSLGAGLRAGYIMDESWFFYATGGVLASKLKYRAVLVPGDELTVGGSADLGHKHKHIAGVYYGIGAEKQLENGHRIGLELTHRYYRKQDMKIEQGAAFIKSSFKPQSVNLKLTYSIPF